MDKRACVVALTVLSLMLLSNMATVQLAGGAGTAEPPSGPWQGASRVDASPSNNERSISSMVLADDRPGEVHAAWLEDRDAGSDFYVATSLDGGATWGHESRVDPHANQPRSVNSTCDIVTDHQGKVWAVYSQRVVAGWRVRFARSDDGALTWRTPIDVYASGDETSVQEVPAMARSPTGLLHILFLLRTPTSARMLVAISEDGLNAGLPRQVDDRAPDTEAHTGGDVVVAPNGTVVIAYGFKSPGMAGIRVATKAAAATSYTVSTVWTVEERIPRELSPRLAVSSRGVVGLVFAPNGSSGALHVRTLDGGATWTDPVRVYQDPDVNATQADPSIAFDALGQMHSVLTHQAVKVPSRLMHSYTSDGSVFTPALGVGADWDTEEDGKRGQEGPGAILPLSNGTLLATYAAARNTTYGIRASWWPNLPPTVTITSPSKGVVVRGTISVMGTALDKGGVSGIASVFVKMGTIGPVKLGGSTSWSHDFDTTGLADGPQEIVAWASDGFVEGPHASLGVTVDNNNPPELEVDFPRDNAKYRGIVPIAGTVYDVEGLAENWNVQWKTNDVNATWMDLPLKSLTDLHNMTFSWPVNLSARQNGQVFLSVRASDGEKWSQVQTRTIFMENRPDLHINVSRIEWSPSKPKSGDEMQFTVYIENRGATRSPTFELTFNIGPKLLDEQTGAGLAPGNYVSLVFFWNATGGTFTFSVAADPRALVDEADDTNNRVTFTLTVEKVVREEEGFSAWILGAIALAAIIGIAGGALLIIRKVKLMPDVVGQEGQEGQGGLGGQVGQGGQGASEAEASAQSDQFEGTEVEGAAEPSDPEGDEPDSPLHP